MCLCVFFDVVVVLFVFCIVFIVFLFFFQSRSCSLSLKRLHGNKKSNTSKHNRQQNDSRSYCYRKMHNVRSCFGLGGLGSPCELFRRCSTVSVAGCFGHDEGDLARGQALQQAGRQTRTEDRCEDPGVRRWFPCHHGIRGAAARVSPGA